MKNKIFYFLLVLILLLSIPVNAEFNELKEIQIIDSFKNSNMPIGKVKIFNSENDPNDLLGRPGQYIGKASWADKRIEQENDEIKGGTLEIFKNKEDLKNRKEYLEQFVNTPMFAQYMYIHKNAIIRLENELTPKQAEQYQKILNNL